MMRFFGRIAFFAAILGVLASSGAAQAQPFDVARVEALLPSPGILRNAVTNLHAEGDSLWVGPFLNLTTDGGASWQVADADSLGFRNRVFSLDVEGQTIWAGLGDRVPVTIDGETQNFDTARGLLVSEDGGLTWAYRTFQPPSDSDPTTTGILDQVADTMLTYGVSTLPALPVVVPELSPPYDIDYDPVRDEVWTANWAAGLRRSADGGRTWERVILPPDELKEIRPDEPYSFEVGPKRTVGDPNGSFNHQAFAVLVDETGTVWGGSPAGLNRSTDGGRSWRRFEPEEGLPARWVISIEEQRLPGAPPAIWATTWPSLTSEERFGAVVSRDGGATFEGVLLGEKLYDFAFRGETVYAAGDNGLFISEDGGETWRTVRDFFDPSRPDQLFRPGAGVFSVATTREALWVGTGDGLFRSTDGGETWRGFRAEVPLSPDTLPPVIPAGAAPRVETYAYPNPFSPIADRIVRIRYALESATSARIRIFDFAMNLVRELSATTQQPGERETAWDGTDAFGARVANGTYFYAVEAGGKTFRGKILVLE